MEKNFPNVKKGIIDTLQINIGYKCNQACKHCHVNSSPSRTEMMSKDIIRIIPEIISKHGIKTLDITGGAPELHPQFKELILSLRDNKIKIIDRCNLTIFFEEGYQYLPRFLAENEVIVYASLPCYEKDNVEKQRGFGVFDKSIEAIKILNKFGYGKSGSNLLLNLVYNPINPTLPPPQDELEDAYKRVLFKNHKIIFNNLFTITNMPINRYAEQLKSKGELDQYLNLLINNFNKKNLQNIMCKNTISVDYLGNIYDCDFNQQINLKSDNAPKTIFDLATDENIEDYEISVSNHCFACTAGSGSSCGGSLS